MPPETFPKNNYNMVEKQPIRKKEVTSRKRTLSLAADNVMNMKAPHSFIVTDEELA